MTEIEEEYMLPLRDINGDELVDIDKGCAGEHADSLKIWTSNPFTTQNVNCTTLKKILIRTFTFIIIGVVGTTQIIDGRCFINNTLQRKKPMQKLLQKDYLSLFSKFNVITVSETWLENEKGSDVRLEGYELFMINRNNKKEVDLLCMWTQPYGAAC